MLYTLHILALLSSLNLSCHFSSSCFSYISVSVQPNFYSSSRHSFPQCLPKAPIYAHHCAQFVPPLSTGAVPMHLPIWFSHQIIRSCRASSVMVYSDLFPQCVKLYLAQNSVLNENKWNLKVNEIIHFWGAGKRRMSS